MHVTLDAPLGPRTTLGVGGPARRLVRVTDVGDLREALSSAHEVSEPVLILGGGSNLVVRDGGWPGLVIHIGITGVSIHDHGDHALVSVFAGVVWDDFVAQMVEAKLVGVECLSGIPGLVGATPMQNVGAYGQEVADTIVHVRVLDRTTNQVETMTPAACEFAYRTSLFKGSDRWVVIEVRFRFPRGEDSAPIAYPELARALGIEDGGRAPLAAVRSTVIELRRGKGMVIDPQDPDSRSAGSFFTNPIVDAELLAAFEARLPPGVVPPKFPAVDGRTKLSAGWLIERAGFAKGFALPGAELAAISRKHALALVNRSGATAAELLALARVIQDGVRDQLGVELTIEPVIVGND